MEKKIYLVGGAVRDRLMGCEICDKDYVAVGFCADDFKSLISVGKDFPVFITENGDELALARVERKVSSGYNGFIVDTQNVTLENDLKRRDLTINSIAYDEKEDRIIDPLNGKKDIEKNILRHTSEAFIEDPIRVLRIARFRAKFGYDWKIHHSTKVLIYSMRDELKSLQKDRVYKEVDKVLGYENSDIFFETLFELGVLDIIFPSLYELTRLKEGSIYHKEDNVFIHTMMVLRNLKNSSKLLKTTALYHDIAKPYCYRKFGNSSGHDSIDIVKQFIDIQLPTKVQKRMLFLIQYHIKIAIILEMKPQKIATFFESFKKDKTLLEDLLYFYNADNEGRITNEEKEPLNKELILRIFDNISSFSPKKWIDGQENRPSGEAIKQFVHKTNISIVKKLLI